MITEVISDCFTGERTRAHFFGEQIESFTNIDMYRRPATTYTGRVVMDYGRPGDGYYTQRFPSMFQSFSLVICGTVARWSVSSVTDSSIVPYAESFWDLRGSSRPNILA